MQDEAVASWLLEDDNPPVRYLALTRLLGHGEDEAEVREAKSRLMSYSVTQEILAHSDEVWNSGPRSFWSYKGRYWNTVFLGHFLADGHDPRIAPGVTRLLEQNWVLDKWTCMSASLLTAFRRLGYGDHPTVTAGTEGLARRLLDEGGITCPGMNTSLMSYCYMALPKYLFCFAELLTDQRSAMVQAAIDWIVKELVAHQVYVYVPSNEKAWDEVRPRSRKKADYPEGETPDSWREKMRLEFLQEHGYGEVEPKQLWMRFGFPLNYNSDILEAMLALAAAGAPMSAALKAPLQVVRDKRTAEGVWLMDKSFNGQMWADVEVKGQPSKWLTLFALVVLKHFEGG